MTDPASFGPLLDPDASEEELRALEERLRRDPAAADTVARLIYIDGLLWEEARPKAVPGRRRSRRWIALGAAAAAVLLLLWLPWRLFSGGPVARIESVRGTSVVLTGAVEVPAATGVAIASGSGFRTSGAGSAATLAFPDGTRLEIGPDTTLEDLGDDGAGKRLRLKRGTIRAAVTPQPPERPMRLATPHGDARVLGTILRLLVDPDPLKGTRLDVEEGKVRLENRQGQGVVVASGHFAVAAAGVELLARPLRSAALALVEKMPSRSWAQIPGTAVRAVAADPARYPKIQGGVGFSSLTESWSGGVLDTRRERLVLWGGGHSNYWGNELYAFDIPTTTWLRLTEPTPDPALDQEAGPDGRPTSRSTYSGLAYLAHVDRLFSHAGGLAGGSAGKVDQTWTFDFATSTWSRRNPPTNPGGGFGCNASYDPATRKVWWGSGRLSFAGLWSYDYEANAWTRHTQDNFSGCTSAVDLKRGFLVVVGNGEVFSYDIRRGTPRKEAWPTAGGEGLLGKPGPGFDYDPDRDRFVGWAGGAVFELDPETKAWRSQDVPGAPASNRNGLYGRWRYVPSLKAFIAVTQVDANVHLYKP